MISEWFKGLFQVISDPIADLSGGYRERKRIATESAATIAQAKVNLKLAKLKAQEKRFDIEQTGDVDYDLQVLQNRSETIVDDIVIITWLIIFISHFIPALQPHMAKGWLAMGYEQVPWWFEFGMVGILVSTLGLMRLFRLLMGRWKNGKIAV
jgi:hypothetical protein